MNEVVNIYGTDLKIKEYNGQRVVTFKDIDAVHQRPEGTARVTFNRNKAHFILGEDYFVCETYEAKKELGIMAPNGITLITESGYLMLVKSFTDDLAWKVQRQLVNSYFKMQEYKNNNNQLSVEDAFKMVELINNTPSDRLPMVVAVLEQTGINIPKNQVQDEFRTNKNRKYKDNSDIADFLQMKDVTDKPTGDVYTEYVNYCSEHNVTPVSKIVFGKIVNQILGTHIIIKKVNKVAKRVFTY